MLDSYDAELKDICDRIARIESRLDEVLSLLQGGIIKSEDSDLESEKKVSPYFNPDTGLFDIRYYRQMQDEGERKKL